LAGKPTHCEIGERYKEKDERDADEQGSELAIHPQLATISGSAIEQTTAQRTGDICVARDMSVDSSSCNMFLVKFPSGVVAAYVMMKTFTSRAKWACRK
jgi:hypothetical protein